MNSLGKSKTSEPEVFVSSDNTNPKICGSILISLIVPPLILYLISKVPESPIVTS